MGFVVHLVAVLIWGFSGTVGCEHDSYPPISHTMFPEGFIFGAATASYQIEGGWDADGKGPNIWDNITHERPSFVQNCDNGDVAADSYHKYKEDVQLLENIGFQMYRFSLSWSRILPNGRINNVNQAGIDHYMNIIDELLAKGIQPMVTIYHWDLPQSLQDIGGWTNPDIVNIFREYADLVFQTFGNKFVWVHVGNYHPLCHSLKLNWAKQVRWWVTINEAFMVTTGYGADSLAPAAFLDQHGLVEYQAARNLLLSHANAYRLYKEKYANQKGKLGMTFAGYFCIPKTDDRKNIEAAERCYQHTYGWFSHPVFVGDYPPEMRKRIDEISKEEGRNTSRLPYFTQNEIDYIKGTSDFYGLNHYTTNLADDQVAGPIPSQQSDMGAVLSGDPSWPQAAASWFKVFPQGLRLHVKKICEEYANPEIIVTENGYVEDGSKLTDDPDRINYLESYLGELRQSIYTDGCNVSGHISWSLMDNFEWRSGYTLKFGLVSVDFDSPNRTRTMKKSAFWMKNYINMHKIYYK